MKKITLFAAAICMAFAVNAQNTVPIDFGFETGQTIDKWASDGLTWEIDSLGAARSGTKCMKVTVEDVTGLDPWSLQYVPQGFVAEQTCYRYTVWTKMENETGLDKTGAEVDATVNITAGNYLYNDRGSKYGVPATTEWTMTTLLIDLTPESIYTTFGAEAAGTNWPTYLTDAGITHAFRLPIHLGACTNVTYVDDVKVIKSFLASATMATSTALVMDFGYQMEDAGIDPAAFTITVDGAEVEATAASLDVETQKVLTLTLASEVAAGAVMTVKVTDPSSAGLLYVGDGPSSNVAEGYIPLLDEAVDTDHMGSGIVNRKAVAQFGIAPNPVENQLTVISKVNVASVAIFDLTGKLMITSFDANIDVTSLKSGAYLVQVTDVKGNVGAKKFVK